MGDEGQVDPQGLQNLHLLDDLLARGRQDAGARRELQEMDATKAHQKARAMKAEAL